MEHPEDLARKVYASASAIFFRSHVELIAERQRLFLRGWARGAAEMRLGLLPLQPASGRVEMVHETSNAAVARLS